MKNYYSLFFGILLTVSILIIFGFDIKRQIKFMNGNDTLKVDGIIDSTFYEYSTGGGTSLTIRVKYIVNNNYYYVFPNATIYFKFERLIGKKIEVIYLKKNPSVSIINTFRERGIFIIAAILFTLLGVFIILKSEGLEKIKNRVV